MTRTVAKVRKIERYPGPGGPGYFYVWAHIEVELEGGRESPGGMLEATCSGRDYLGSEVHWGTKKPPTREGRGQFRGREGVSRTFPEERGRSLPVERQTRRSRP